VNTLAGDAGWTSAATGDAAAFDNPNLLALNLDGALAVACSGNRTVVSVPAAGTRTRLIGFGTTADRYLDGADRHGLVATLDEPGGIAVARDGTIYFSDSVKNVIRRIKPDGRMDTLAGLAGSTGYVIVNGVGSAARFQDPRGLALDADENLYVADTLNNAIRKITPQGNVTTFATGFAGMEQLVFNPTDGSFFAADASNSVIKRISAGGAVSIYAGSGDRGFLAGPANVAKFYSPVALALAADGTLYVSDTGSTGNVIWKITTDREVSLFAGSVSDDRLLDATGTAARFANLRTLAMGPDGNLYGGEFAAGVLRRITPEGVVTSLAGGGNGYVDGVGNAAGIAGISALAIDSLGRVYLGQRFDQVLRLAVPATVVPSLVGPTTITARANEPFQYQAVASTGAAVRFAYPLPPGLTFNPATGLIAGEAVSPGTYSLGLTVGNAFTESTTDLTLTLLPARPIAEIQLQGLLTEYTGTPRIVTATTVPAGLPVTIRYNGETTPPINVGGYTVTATVDTATHRGAATGNLVVGKDTAAITFGELGKIYTGSAQGVSVTTVPAGLKVTVTYGGSLNAPVNAGTYAVVATIDENPGYIGSASGTLVIAKAGATVTLGALSRVYDGTSRAVGFATTPAGLPVNITYDNSATPPTNAGSYAVAATITDLNHTGNAAGTLVIAKAPLTVSVDAQARLSGQTNPQAILRFSGFVGGDTEADLAATRPLGTSTAGLNSPAGEYPITLSGGVDANYTYILGAGTLRVVGLAGTYEALLKDEQDLPYGMVTLTLPRTGLGYTGVLTLVDEAASITLSNTARPAGSKIPHGPLTPDAARPDGLASASGVWRRTATAKLPALELLLTVDSDGGLGGVLTRGGKASTLEHGRMLRTGKTGAPGTGDYTLRLAPPARHPAGTADTRPLPQGAGHATAKIDPSGQLKLTGRLPDGQLFTGAVKQDLADAYRVFLKPHGTNRVGNVLAAWLPLEPSPLGSGLRRSSGSWNWSKPASIKDPTYRGGFGPVVMAATLEAWQAPVADNRKTPVNETVTLAQRLRLIDAGAAQASASALVALDFIHGGLTEAQQGALPFVRTLLATNTFAPVLAADNPSQLKITLTPGTGAFSGSFRVAVPAPTATKPNATALKTVTFTGALFQPATGAGAEAGLIGSGVFTLPGATSKDPSTTGEIRLEAPAGE
jgi:sugar lactone lactonase YvrE